MNAVARWASGQHARKGFDTSSVMASSSIVRPFRRALIAGSNCNQSFNVRDLMWSLVALVKGRQRNRGFQVRQSPLIRYSSVESGQNGDDRADSPLLSRSAASCPAAADAASKCRRRRRAVFDRHRRRYVDHRKLIAVEVRRLSTLPDGAAISTPPAAERQSETAANVGVAAMPELHGSSPSLVRSASGGMLPSLLAAA